MDDDITDRMELFRKEVLQALTNTMHDAVPAMALRYRLMPEFTGVVIPRLLIDAGLRYELEPLGFSDKEIEAFRFHMSCTLRGLKGIKADLTGPVDDESEI